MNYYLTDLVSSSMRFQELLLDLLLVIADFLSVYDIENLWFSLRNTRTDLKRLQKRIDQEFAKLREFENRLFSRPGTEINKFLLTIEQNCDSRFCKRIYKKVAQSKKLCYHIRFLNSKLCIQTMIKNGFANLIDEQSIFRRPKLIPQYIASLKIDPKNFHFEFRSCLRFYPEAGILALKQFNEIDQEKIIQDIYELSPEGYLSDFLELYERN